MGRGVSAEIGACELWRGVARILFRFVCDRWAPLKQRVGKIVADTTDAGWGNQSCVPRSAMPSDLIRCDILCNHLTDPGSRPNISTEIRLKEEGEVMKSEGPSHKLSDKLFYNFHSFTKLSIWSQQRRYDFIWDGKNPLDNFLLHWVQNPWRKEVKHKMIRTMNYLPERCSLQESVVNVKPREVNENRLSSVLWVTSITKPF